MEQPDYCWKQIFERLPTHLLNSGDWKTAEKYLCDLQFCADKCHANLLGDLFKNFKESIKHKGHRDAFSDYYNFLRASAHVFRKVPGTLVQRVLLQQALNCNDGSKARKDAIISLRSTEDIAYFEWLNRPTTRAPCQSIYSYPNNHIWVSDFSWDAKYLAFGCSDNLVHIIESENGDEVLTMEGHSDDIAFVKFNPKQKGNELVTVASCRPQERERSYSLNVANGSKLQVYDTEQFVMDMKFCPKGEQLAIVCNKSFCKILKKSSKSLIYEERIMYNLAASCCTFTLDTNLIIIGMEHVASHDSEDDEGASCESPSEMCIFEAAQSSEENKRPIIFRMQSVRLDIQKTKV